ncbi:MAG: hypothetical protein GX957_00035 [Clostridiaceae bacterium]|nr:hypothetical protein [Clostridiaceae bacterium]
MLLDYKIKFEPIDKIIEIPDGQQVYEFILSKINESGFDIKNIIEGRNSLQVSCAMPENTVIRPLLPMEFTRKIEKEDYPYLKKLKSIKYISEDLLSRIEIKTFFQIALDNLKENKWELKDDILLRRHQDLSFNMKESLEPVRMKIEGGFITKTIPVFNAEGSLLQFFVRTDIMAVENLLKPGSYMDLGLYNSYEIKEIFPYYKKDSNTGILLSKYCPISLENEINIEKSFFRTGMINSIQYIKEGSFLKIKKNYNGQVFVKENLIFNGKGYLYYI